MSKVYSNKRNYSLVEEELEELTYKPTSFLEKLLFRTSRKLSAKANLKYTFLVPVSEFLRGEVFCDDVSEAMESDFTQRDLISILLEDFLYQAKRRSNPFDLYNELVAMSYQPSIQIVNYGEEEELIPKNSPKRKRIECIIKRKEALRLEVMLSDIAELELERTFTVSEVLQILYSGFIYKYKNGELTNVLENILKRLSK